MSAETKKCTKCGEVKALDEFALRDALRGVRRGVCKDCKRAGHKAWRDGNREHVRSYGKETMRRLYANNPEKFRAKSNEFYRNNKDVCQLRQRNWRTKNHSHVLRYAKMYRIANPDSVKKCREQWKAKNRDKIVAYKAATRDALKDSYVKRVLFNNESYACVDIPAEIVQEKRDQLIVSRIARQLKQTIKEVFK